MTSTADPEYVAWRRISEWGLGYDFPDFPMEVLFFLINNAGDDGIPRGGEGDKDDAVIDSPYARTKMGQTIDFYLGQSSYVHMERVTIFGQKGK
jgi:hypothetical protein